MKTTTQTPFTERQKNQLTEIQDTATKYVRQEYQGGGNYAAEAAVVRLQRKFPTALPHLLCEAAYFAVENSSLASSAEKERVNFQRARCKIARLGVYEDLGLTFNV